MKSYLALVVAAVVLAIAAPSALAVRFQMRDPVGPLATTPPMVTCASNTPCNMFYLDQTYQAGFVPCSTSLPPSQDTTGFNWCLWMNNVSGEAINNISFQLTVPQGGSLTGNGVSCEGIAPLVTDNCPTSLPAIGDEFTLSFLASPALEDGHDFYVLTDFINSPGVAGVTASVPEPSELGLLGLGLLVLGVGCGLQRRRRKPRTYQMV